MRGTYVTDLLPPKRRSSSVTHLSLCHRTTHIWCPHWREVGVLKNGCRVALPTLKWYFHTRRGIQTVEFSWYHLWMVPLRVPVPAPHTRMKYAIIFGNMHIISQSQVRNGTDHRAIEAMYVVHHCLFYCSFENTWGVCINVSENINNHGV